MSEAAIRRAPSRVIEDVVASSFDDVYRRECVPMVRLAVLLVGSQEAAEEIVQDAFAQLFERWDGVDRPGAYVRACVVNGCRRSHRRRHQDDRAVAGLAGPTATGLGAENLVDALAALPPRRRAAVVLRYYEDLSEAEIAEALGVRPGTVKSLLDRGLAQLRGVLERPAAAGPPELTAVARDRARDSPHPQQPKEPFTLPQLPRPLSALTTSIKTKRHALIGAACALGLITAPLAGTALVVAVTTPRPRSAPATVQVAAGPTSVPTTVPVPVTVPSTTGPRSPDRGPRQARAGR